MAEQNFFLELESLRKIESVKTLKVAMSLHQKGQWTQAEELYRLLKYELPSNANLHAIHGVLLHQRGRYEGAYEEFSRSLQLDENQKIATNYLDDTKKRISLTNFKNIKISEIDVKDFCKDSESFLEESLNKNEITLNNINNNIHENLPEGAINCLNLSGYFNNQGRFLESIACLHKAFKLCENSSLINYKYASILNKLYRYNDARIHFTNAILVNKKDVNSLNDRSTVFYNIGDYENALRDIESALKLAPQNAQCHRNRAYILVNLKKIDDALFSYNQSLFYDPMSAETLNNLGMALEIEGNLSTAKQCYEQARILKEDLYLVYWNKALVHLRLGEYEKGWKLFEYRWKTEMADKERVYTEKLWRGENLKGKTILLHYEQGLGDAIQFCRYATLFDSKDTKIILEVQDSMIDIISTISKKVKVVGSGKYKEKIDFRCPLMDLPNRFRTTLDTIPCKSSYIFSDKFKSKKWSEKLPSNKKKRIGLVWSGRETHNNDHNRSIPLSKFVEILKIDADFISLQKEVRASDNAFLKIIKKVKDFRTDLNNFSDTAALIENLDLVISVDTSVAHLAAAMGKPVWVILPYWPDYRWLERRIDSPWYSSVRLFRQDKTETWDKVLKNIFYKLKSNESYLFDINQKKKSLAPNFKDIFKDYLIGKIDLQDILLVSEIKKILELFESENFSKIKVIVNFLQNKYPNNKDLLNFIAFTEIEYCQFKNAQISIKKCLEIDKNDSTALMLKGMLAQNNTNYIEAEKFYIRSLDINKDNIYALHKLAELKVQSESESESLELYEKLLCVDSFDSIALRKISHVYEKRGDYKNAIKYQLRYIEIFSEDFKVLAKLSKSYYKVKNYKNSLKYINLALDYFPEGTDKSKFYFFRSIILEKLGRFQEAIFDCDKVILFENSNYDSHMRKAELLKLCRNDNDALKEYMIAKDLKTDCQNSRLSIAIILTKKKEYSQALKYYDELIRLDSKNPNFYVNRGGIYQDLKKYQLCLDESNKALAIDNNYPGALLNKGAALEQIGNYKESLRCFREILKNDKNHIMANWNLSLLMLREGNFEEGWCRYEYRIKTDRFKNNELNFPYKYWSGKENLNGKNILLFHEQGYGDTIQFCRYIKFVLNLGANVFVAVTTNLANLFATIDERIKIVTHTIINHPIDFQCPLMSLPHRFKTRLDSVPAEIPYLFSQKDKKIFFKSKLNQTGKFKIGLVWSGRSNHANDHNRSIALNQFRHLIRNDCEYICLQKEIKKEEYSLLKLFNIQNFQKNLFDFSDTAALLDNLDLIITVDTSVAHLSGAVGKKTFLMLPFWPEWRWMNKLDYSPWYPNMKIFRQRKKNCWHHVFEKINFDLDYLLKKKNGDIFEK